MAAFQVSVPDAAIWKCLRSGWKWWERMKRLRKLMVSGKVGKGRVADEVK